jgi:hypothetical protein
LESDLGRTCSEASEEFSLLVNEIESFAKCIGRLIEDIAREYVQKRWVKCSALDEQYEWELEKQVEEEVERELPARSEPGDETPWDPSLIFEASFIRSGCAHEESFPKLFPILSVLENTFCFEDYIKKKQIVLDPTLFVTQNFLTALKHELNDVDEGNDSGKCDDNENDDSDEDDDREGHADCRTDAGYADNYMRSVDVVVTVSHKGSPRYVLLSGREADNLLPLMWHRAEKEKNDTGTFVAFDHYPHLGGELQVVTTQANHLGHIPDRILVQLKFLMGECAYGPHGEELRKLLGYIAWVDVDLLDEVGDESVSIEGDVSCDDDDRRKAVHNWLRNESLVTPVGLLTIDANDIRSNFSSLSGPVGVDMMKLKNFLLSRINLQRLLKSGGEFIQKLVGLRGRTQFLEGSDVSRTVRGLLSIEEKVVKEE